MGDKNNNTNNIRGDIPIPSSLGEDSTEPVDSNSPTQVPVGFGQMSRELQEFVLTGAAPNLCRGLPYVHHIVYDAELEMPHIWLRLKAPIRNVTPATEKILRHELECFADQIERYFEKGFAISVRLN